MSGLSFFIDRLEACPETNKAKNTTTQNDAEANLSKFKQILRDFKAF